MNEIATTEVVREVGTFLAAAKSFIINSDEDFAEVDAHCAYGLAIKKKIEADFAPTKAAAYASWKTVVSQESGHLDGIDAGRRIEKQLMDAYLKEKEAVRAAQEATLQAAAKAQAESDAISRAVAMEAAGQQDEADAIIAQPVEAPVVVVPRTVPKAETVIRKVKKFEVTDASKLPRQYLTPNMTAIGGVVRSLGLAANIPGIRIWEEAA